MDTRRSRRKRCNSSVSELEPCSPGLRNRARREEAADCAPCCETPRQPNKRVRFSDPGPKLHHSSGYSTGLTPAMCRASFEEPEDAGAVQHTPSRKLRRRSAPLSRSRRVTDSALPRDSASSGTVLHFTPLRQLLDSRTQRRIRRLGLSDEINNLEREKRVSAQYEKALQSLLQERDSLKQELESAKKSRASLGGQFTSDEGELMEGCQVSVAEDLVNQSTVSGSEADTIIINDSGFEGDTLLMSDSPDIRGIDLRHSSIPDDLSLLSQHVDASNLTLQPISDQNSDFLALSHDLELARKEKRHLFDACRSRLGSLDGTALARHLHRSSPPPEFLDDILPTLMQTLNRASEATHILDSIQHELTILGFSGSNAPEMIAEMRDHFRSARLELERAVPGETPNAGLNNGHSTLSALVKRVEVLVKDLGEERTRHQGSADRERALRGQFDNLLVRYEAASKKIHDLEDSISSSAGDMLHTRMRMQELEREVQEQATGIDRLNTALSKYHEEVKGLEALVTKLEDERAKCSERHSQQISDMKQKITAEENARHTAETTVIEREKRISELEEVIEQNKIRVCDLTTKIEMIEHERCEAVKSLQQNTAEQARKHEQEIGLMNVHVSKLNTALEAAKTESEKLRLSNAGLEEQLRQEIDTRDNLLDKWASEQARSFAYMKATVNTERRKAKVRAANWELKSDELQSDSIAIGSEPITPVSMTRFVDVEVGRGKTRRRLDSGIGILTEDELEDDIDSGFNVQLLPSDPADL